MTPRQHVALPGQLLEYRMMTSLCAAEWGVVQTTCGPAYSLPPINAMIPHKADLLSDGNVSGFIGLTKTNECLDIFIAFQWTSLVEGLIFISPTAKGVELDKRSRDSVVAVL